MASRSLAGLVLDEAAEVLGELGTWLRLAHACPKCAARQGCSHLGRCPLRRIARLRCLLGSGDPQRRGEALVALRRERAELATSAGDRRLPASTASEVTLTSSVIEVLRAMSVPLEPGALTVVGETTVPTLAPAPPTAPAPPRRLLTLLRRLLGRLCAAQPRRRGARRAFASRRQRGGSTLVARSARCRAARDGERRARRKTRGMDPVPPLWRLVLLLLPQAREGHLWPSRVTVEHAMRLHRRAVIRLFRELDQRAVLATRPRDVVAGKAGAP